MELAASPEFRTVLWMAYAFRNARRMDMLNIKELEEMGKKGRIFLCSTSEERFDPAYAGGKGNVQKIIPAICMQNAGAVLPDAEILKYAEKKDRKVQGRHYCPRQWGNWRILWTERETDDGDRSGS